MAKPSKGKITLDGRDSQPDGAPFLASKATENAPNVLVIAWDDVGYGTMDGFGGPVKAPTGLLPEHTRLSAISPHREPPFTGGTTDKVVVDVSGERYVDHEAQVRGWFIVGWAPTCSEPEESLRKGSGAEDIELPLLPGGGEEQGAVT
ncbi:hypothetical protein AB5J49_03185 [Streptomyces sp. R28]|uniref:Arylsulfatase n=1 Tax=Streptomyces sp. R28 TaxID=3238628 RepID=A0AB39PRA9_9ACTN